MASCNDVNEEIWKPILGFDDYEVSDHGRVKSYSAGRSIVCKVLRHGRILPTRISIFS